MILKLFSFFRYSELPWDQPSLGCREYIVWKDNRYATITPWSKLDTLSLAFIRKILVPNPEKRLLLDKIKLHKWCSIPAPTTGNVGWKVLDEFIACMLVLVVKTIVGEVKVIESFPQFRFFHNPPHEGCAKEIDKGMRNGNSPPHQKHAPCAPRRTSTPEGWKVARVRLYWFSLFHQVLRDSQLGKFHFSTTTDPPTQLRFNAVCGKVHCQFQGQRWKIGFPFFFRRRKFLFASLKLWNVWE